MFESDWKTHTETALIRYGASISPCCSLSFSQLKVITVSTEAMKHARQELVVWLQDQHDTSVIVVLTDDVGDKSEEHLVQ
jgi:hypothetical protein